MMRLLNSHRSHAGSAGVRSRVGASRPRCRSRRPAHRQSQPIQITWSPFADCYQAAFVDGRFDGIGFVFHRR